MPTGTPYALGRFRADSGAEFCGVVIGPDVVPLPFLLPAAGDIGSLLRDWTSNRKLLDAAVDDPSAAKPEPVATSNVATNSAVYADT